MRINYSAAVRAMALFLALLFPLSNAIEAQKQDTTFLYKEPVVITSAKILSSLSELSRNVISITKAEIANAPATTLQDIFPYTSGLDVKKRGPEGVQSDISIMGGSFEQTVVMLDGVKMSDPQTGHHNMNLPINTTDVERIEILKGQSSSIYGPNAVSGVINIITKKGDKPGFSINTSGGSFGYYNWGASLSTPLEQTSNLISFSRSKSDGYRHNTDFTITTAFAHSSIPFSSGSANVSAGYTERAFGANSFYSPKYLNQWEKTKTFFLASGVDLTMGEISLSPSLYWRNNKDHYLLDYQNPSGYTNDHSTDAYGLELNSFYSGSGYSLVLGGELSFDNIVSTNLGDHRRKKGGVTGEVIILPTQDLTMLASVSVYNYNDYGGKTFPGINFVYQLSQTINLHASAGKAFRVPTFTELYYSSPVQKGNALLVPETAVTFETGINFTSGNIAADLNGFTRHGHNLIDWVRSSPTVPWYAQNITNINTTGLDMGLTLSNLPVAGYSIVNKLKFGYTWLSSDIANSAQQSQYILDILRHQLVVDATHELPLGFIMNWIVRYENRYNLDSYIICDAKLSVNWRMFNVSLAALNVFDDASLDISGIPLPGRWLKAGIEYQWRK